MSSPVPTIRVRVDVTNPGQFFACCGVLELASRLANSDVSVAPALAWFERDSPSRQWHFHLANTSSLADLLAAITSAEIEVLDDTDNHSAVRIASPFNLHLDWWRYENRATGKLKTWAGQMKASSILATLCAEVKKALPMQDKQNLFAMEGAPADAVSYFDAPRSANAAARDVGFSLDRLKKGGVVIRNILHPFVELFCFIGLQRTRPALLKWERGMEQMYAYYLWLNPISVSILPIAVIGELSDRESNHYQFVNPSRTQDYRAFTTAKAVPNR
jgi:hypothetical protein